MDRFLSQIRLITNSITQGEQVTNVWKPLYEKFGIHIDFAHRSFKWENESTQKAKVHCVIIGNSVAPNPKPKFIFDGNNKILAQNINFYLQDAEIIFVEPRRNPVCNVPKMETGGKPVEGGNLILTPAERDNLIAKEPVAEKFIRPLIGGDEFINGKIRYCLWLVNATPHELNSMPLVMERVQAVRDFRLHSTKAKTRADADRPTEFQEIREQTANYIVIPETSSAERNYIPIGFIDAAVIPTNAVRFIPNANIYDFGVLTSKIHMAWMRAVGGRLGEGYKYSNTIVYNNFVWCNPTEQQRAKIESAAQIILNVRAKFPDASLADLYNELTMPIELRRAHLENDRAVMQAYNFRADMSESEIVSALMKMYQRMRQQKIQPPPMRQLDNQIRT